jgi:two-component system, OmpR family, response regulator
MHTPDSILIVDDDAEIRSLLASYLGKNGYRSMTAADGREMRRVLDRQNVDLIVLDLMLPGEDGLELCRELRARSNIPVVMLTARGEETDRIVGLEMGADDYVPKPFNPRELLARIKAVLRRSRSLPDERAPTTGQGFAFGRWRVDFRTRSLRDEEDVVVPLSTAEYELLVVFLNHPGRVLDRDQLMDLTRGRDAMPFDRSIDMQVSRLRKRLGADEQTPEYIKTVRSRGYLFVPTVEMR